MGQRKKRNSQPELRELLNSYKEKLKATTEEIRSGLGISRPTLTNFLTGKLLGLSIDPSDIISLYDKLITEKEYNNKESSFANEERKNLKGRGPDELLVAAGFLPVITKMIRVTEKRFGQIVQVAALLDDKLLSDEDLLEIVTNSISNISARMQLRKINSSQSSSTDSENTQEAINIIRADLKSNPIYNIDFVSILDRKLNNVAKGLIKEGKNTLNNQEVMALYRSILLKQLMQKETTSLYIKVVKIDFQSVSLDLKSFDLDSKSDDFQSVAADLQKIIQELEEKTNYKIYFQIPVTRAILTCDFGIKENTKIQNVIPLTWSYTSGSTLLSNAVSAAALQIGYNQDKYSFKLLTTTKTLGSSPNSLVETTVILDGKFQGSWVDRDSIKSVCQALIEAGKYWIYGQILKNNKIDIENYFNTCQILSNLRERMNKVREIFNELKFEDRNFNDNEIQKIENESIETINKLPINQSIYDRHRIELYRFYLTAISFKLRLDNIRGNARQIPELLKNFNEKWIQIERDDNSEMRNELMPLKVLIRSDILLYQLSRGEGAYLSSAIKDSENFLQVQSKEILLDINPNGLFQDQGVDTYLSFSEIYGNTARVIFYLSQRKAEIEQASKYFLIAACYSMKIGSKQKTARWLALAGRTQVRLGNREKSIQLLNTSKELANQGLQYSQDPKLKAAILSEMEILEGEYMTLIDYNYEEAIKHFILALKGSIYLGFGRRIADSLYGIARCIDKVDIEKVNLYARDEEVFGLGINFFQQNDWNKKYNPTSNQISESALHVMKNTLCNENPHDLSTKNYFLHYVALIWQAWDEIIFDESLSQTYSTINDQVVNNNKFPQIHPTAKLIEEAIQESKDPIFLNYFPRAAKFP